MKIGELINALDLDTVVSIHADYQCDWSDEKNPYFMAKPCREITWNEYRALQGKTVLLVQTLRALGSEPDTYDYIDVTYG